jgi:hypothetical protein
MKHEDLWRIHGIMINGEAGREVWVEDVVREYSSYFLGQACIVIRPDDEDKLNRLLKDESQMKVLRSWGRGWLPCEMGV